MPGGDELSFVLDTGYSEGKQLVLVADGMQFWRIYGQELWSHCYEVK